MKRVKIFSHVSDKELEYQINDWLKDNSLEILDIKYQSCCNSKTGDIWFSALVIYKN